MRKVPFTVDGIAYAGLHVVSLKRSFSVSDGPNAGRVMTGDMLRDVIGTYYNYSIEIDSDGASRVEYDQFYEVISGPDDYHMVTFPYGQNVLTFKAYVSNGEDALDFLYDEDSGWSGLSLNFVAMAPQRRPA